MRTVPTPTGVLDGYSLENEFSDNFRSVEQFAYIESAYITVDGVRRFERDIHSATDRGVRVCAFVQRPDHWSRREDPRLSPAIDADLRKFSAAVGYLRRLGAHVTLRPGTHLKVAVFDGIKTYEGSLNFLSYTLKTDEEVLKWTDPLWSQATMRRRRLQECHECKLELKDAGAICMRQTAGELGKQICDLRRRANLSQDELAMRMGVRRETISRIESGKYAPRADLLVRILELLNKRLLAVPPSVVSLLESWSAFSPD